MVSADANVLIALMLASYLWEVHTALPMPRLSNTSYLQIYHELHEAWLNDAANIFLLDANEQWALHEYFRISERLTDAQLLEHRQTLPVNSSLPQRAGAPTVTGNRSTHVSARFVNASRPCLDRRRTARNGCAFSVRSSRHLTRKPSLISWFAMRSQTTRLRCVSNVLRIHNWTQYNTIQ